ncbi:MAG TPA: hypothetical protein VHQ03_11230, partial [Candidatus Dormibacteraeota bacterium]|nr:hypothetical protein [Candidatus Dormibacteraeota bacterium]
TLACLAECPNTECGEPLEIELTVDSLLQPPYLAPQLWYETQVDGGRLLRFRLPTGGDQEHVAELAAADLPGAEARLWSLCVDGVAPNERNEALDQRVSRLMEDSDPQAEVAVDMTCPACGANFSAGFDAGGYLVAKLEHRRGELIHQVHLLASHYRWAEADILDLSPPRRLAYVHAIEDELGAAAS